MFLLLLVLCWKSVSCSTPVIRVEEGALVGTSYELPNGRIVNAFLGIPYAAPPIAELRFEEPRKSEPWAGVRNASILQNHCLQVGFTKPYSISGDEDCLYLNIYTPKLYVKDNTNQLMNVMVYIHGGAFMFGNGVKCYPDYILQNDDLVYVSINYRLGILGFFSTGDENAPGNFGLKDQVAALKWIQRNINHFGGNPSSVTIVGLSAGGASVHYHYISPQTEGLFQKGISLSGTVLSPWTLPKNVTEKCTQLAASLGCGMNNTKEMVKCLKTKPAQAVVEQTKNFLAWRYNPFTPFGPVVEPESPSAFLSSHPIELLRNGKVKDLPWMTSVVDKEGLFPGAEYIPHDDILEELDNKWNEILPHLLMYNYSVPEQEKNLASYAIRNFYFQDKAISKETIDPLIRMIGDRLFNNGMFHATKLHNSAVKNDVYCYKFIYRGKYSITNYFSKNHENYGTSHADDLSYTLKFLPHSSQETESDKAMVKLMSSIYVNFMKTGNPATGLKSWKPIPKDQHSNLTCLNIYSPSDVELENISNLTIIKFWRNTLPDEYPYSVARCGDLSPPVLIFVIINLVLMILR